MIQTTSFEPIQLPLNYATTSGIISVESSLDQDLTVLPQKFPYSRNFFDRPRYTYKYAPSWWCAYGEPIFEDYGDEVILEYGDRILKSTLIRVDPIATATARKDRILIGGEYYSLSLILEKGWWRQILEDINGNLSFPSEIQATLTKK
ncbi:MAG TPA: hypothetical protein VK203_07405 [Nostocaceae cyanobacterium]|nr:hypothetical protein [Nostocaceae cyanobacterium]